VGGVYLDDAETVAEDVATGSCVVACPGLVPFGVTRPDVLRFGGATA
jgi:hypothetical protein